ncbi:hypothetical protein [Streptomyces sp. NBC_01257]|uniref:hypothetical protein n=1 Tax=Streptomyces sp. NBC_01257 TaxID=2903799 RepID=UPI002DD89DB3|nr:hypothetical protein [Streptomyces sp. NBC_01257]WRZ66119.1 hypothetical protein OG408_20560 [Streptomyces sp. NBC_01257]
MEITTATRSADEQRREDRNRRRREQRRIEGRLRMARHAAHDLITYGPWNGDGPAATVEDVIRQTAAMYGGYLKNIPLTEAEAEIALGFAKNLKASFEDNQRPVREAARRILAA